MTDKVLQETLEVNKKQAEFYNTKKKNLPTRIWSTIREKTLKDIRKELNILQESYDLHKSWFGDLSTKKVLDLGCYSGNYHSLYLAQNSKKYIGLDLSTKAIDKLNTKLKDIPHAKALAVDFLSDDFKEHDFDLIYAYGVLHHFKDVDLLIAKLNEKLAKDGQIISYDPLQTSPPIWFLRKLYRPFQSDAAWEWPFTRRTLKKFDSKFIIKESRGVLGYSKWYFLIRLLPFGDEKKKKIGNRLHQKDLEKSNTSKHHLYSCMQVTMLMQKR